MKFATLAAFVAVAAAQDEEATCDKTKPESCPPVDDVVQACATMTMDGFSVDQCVNGILCGEKLELNGDPIEYSCGTGEVKASASEE